MEKLNNFVIHMHAPNSPETIRAMLSCICIARSLHCVRACGLLNSFIFIKINWNECTHVGPQETIYETNK